jgi:hypothetical protein
MLKGIAILPEFNEVNVEINASVCRNSTKRKGTMESLQVKRKKINFR